jgi:hypothetical protein
MLGTVKVCRQVREIAGQRRNRKIHQALLARRRARRLPAKAGRGRQQLTSNDATDTRFEPNAPPVTEITRPELKSIATPAYFAGSGIQLTEAIANDLATLKVDMVRMELIGENDATKSICYPAYDRIVDRLAARQIRVLGLLDYQSIASVGGADWATDDFRLRFVARVQEIVSHYSSRANPIRHWEIWNEEDICVTGYCPRVDPEPFGRILADSYHAIKAIDAGATVVLGGISPKGFEYTSNYLGELYATAALQGHLAQYGYHPFDVVGAHPYAEVFSAPNPGLTQVLDTKVKAVMNANGDAAKKVWLTEMGWNTSQVSERNQGDYLTESYLMLDAHRPRAPENGPYVRGTSGSATRTGHDRPVGPEDGEPVARQALLRGVQRPGTSERHEADPSARGLLHTGAHARERGERSGVERPA